MLKGETTKQRILDTATDLIHKRGINVVSVGDVLSASGTGKSQFYSHFESRDDLVRSVLRCNERRISDALAHPISNWYDVKSWLFMHLNDQRMFEFERGCSFGTAAYALNSDQIEERVPLRRILDHIRDRLALFLTSEQKAGRLKSSASPLKLANFAAAAVQGGLLIGLIEQAETGNRAVLEECYAHLVSFRI